MKRQALLFLSLYLFGTAVSQNLEKIGKKDALKINGGLNYNAIFYDAKGANARRDPYSWFFSGNINLSILDWSIPFTYSYSNQQGVFTQPFDQYGIMPQYKWFKGYAGFSNMTFSPYTLSGHVFLGGGVEVSPNNWKVAAMYGRLKKAVAYDVVNSSDINMSYERKGYGVRGGYEKNGFGCFVNLFHAKDDLTSLLFIPVNTQVLPIENTVVSTQVKARVGRALFYEGEYALSGLTRSLYSEVDREGENYLSGLFTLRSGSQFFSAMKSSLGYRLKRCNVSLNYERIDPDYQTLGAYYFNNDLENITIAPSVRLFKDKLNLSFNTGYQRNNLDGKKLSTIKRMVGSANLSYAHNERLSATAAYSNFTTYTRLRPQDDPYFSKSTDTLDFYQLAQTANASINYLIGKSTKARQAIMLSGAYQLTGERTGTHYGLPSAVINANAGYSLSWMPTKISGVMAVNVNQSHFNSMKVLYLGPNISVGKSFLENKLRTSIGTSWNEVLNNGERISTVLNNKLTVNYAPKIKNKKYGKPAISLNANHLHRFAYIGESQDFDEFTLMLNLSYGF